MWGGGVMNGEPGGGDLGPEAVARIIYLARGVLVCGPISGGSYARIRQACPPVLVSPGELRRPRFDLSTHSGPETDDLVISQHSVGLGRYSLLRRHPYASYPRVRII